MKKIKRRLIQLMILIKTFFYYVVVQIQKVDNSNLWLISERGIDARDNGYTFYKFIKEKHPEIDVKFIISSDSPDNSKIDKNDIVFYRSKQHYKLFLSAGFLISTHIMGFSPELALFSKLDKYNIIKLHGRKVFLQHGITKDYCPGLDNYNINIDLFICGAKPEYEYILKNFHYTEQKLKYTGFSRFDYLKNTSSNNRQILIMPTWRNYLYYETKETFEKTDYFKYWNSLLNSKTFDCILKKYDYNVIFYPHYEMQKFIDCFKTYTNRITIADFKNYDVQKLLCDSNVLITDYSSVFFDFAYMRKKIIYYQFDYNEYRKKQYKEGYYEYERDGFGPVFKDEDSLLHELEKSEIKQLDSVYVSRVDSFFQYADSSNSERIYKEIMKLK